MKIRRALYGILWAITLLALAFVAGAQDALPRFEPADCMFDLSFLSQPPECGYVVVPEDHTNPDAGTIRLAVAVYRAQGANPQPDPIIFLHGGPGGNALETFGPYFDFVFTPFNQDRDFIIFDQRGTGYSAPSLDCPEVQAFFLEQLPLDLPDAELAARSAEALQTCRDRLLANDVNLAVYNSFQNGADVADLAQALGYDQLNLYGSSYGTRLALEVMRDHPAVVRSAVLDAVLPPQVDLSAATMFNVDRVLNKLFDDCAADPQCNAAYPNLKDVLFEAADQLNENPVLLPVTIPSTGETHEGLLNGDSLVTVIYQVFYITDAIPSIPKMIYDAREGNFDQLIPLLGQFIDDSSSEGMTYSVNCHDETAFSSLDAVLQSYEEYPEFAPYIRSDDDVLEASEFSDCALWGAGEAPPVENEPVISDIPALIINAEYDPVTPPEWGRMVAETLSSSFVFEFPQAGHSASVGDACAVGILQQFFDDPATEPDASCIDSIVKVFTVPFNAGAVSMSPYSSASLGISALQPQGWIEREEGVFDYSSGLPSLAYRVPQDGHEGYIERIIRGGYGYTDLPEPLGTREANGLIWTFYNVEGQGVFTTFAFSSDGDRDYVIGIVAETAEQRAALYEPVFLAAVDAFRPTQGA